MAKFAQPNHGMVGTLQHWLHINPALVPLIVLVLSIAVFGLLLGSKSFSPFALTLILQKTTIVRIVGFLNGWLIAFMRLPPFIVTLGMWQIALATNFLFSANEIIRSQGIAGQAPLLQVFGTTFKVGGLCLRLARSLWFCW